MTLEDDTIRSITGIVNDVKHYQIENERLRQQLKNRDRELVAAKVNIRKLEGKLQVPEAGLSVHHHYGYEVSNTIQVPDAGQPAHQHYGYDVSKTKVHIVSLLSIYENKFRWICMFFRLLCAEYG